MCYCPGEGQQSVATPSQLLSETQLQIDISRAFQGNYWDLTLFRQFWQCICTSMSDKCVIVLEEGNNLWHCLLNCWPKLSLKLGSAWFEMQIAENLHCSDSFDNAFALAHRVYLLLSWRRATICGIASPIGAQNLASNLYQHGFTTGLLRSHTVQTVLTMHLHQPIGYVGYCIGEGQQSVALPPQLVPKTQLEIYISMALKQIAETSHCPDSFNNAFAAASWVNVSDIWRRATICGIASPIGVKNSAWN